MIFNHGNTCVYFSTNIVVAAFYIVYSQERHDGRSPYGSNKAGQTSYVEYYLNALFDSYGSRKVYLLMSQFFDTTTPLTLLMPSSVPNLSKWMRFWT